MHNINIEDTISAISTPIATGAISVIRLSGKDSVKIANKFFSKDISNFKSHTIHLGKILDENKNTIDTVMLSIMKSPNSYTGEDVIEISCHGGIQITQNVFEITLKNGARAAEGGEFTLRAFLNNKLDLSQAEAVQELIFANSNAAIKFAKNNLEGLLSKEIKYFQEELSEIAAILEASLDFPEEDLEFDTFDNIKLRLNKTIKKMQKLISTYDDGKVIFEGKTITIVGSPNVGKSSLMNSLLKKNRAIVTNIKGTTRDILEDSIKIKNLNYKLIDTAGIRETDEIIEKEGIKRSKKAIDLADITILVLDASNDLLKDDLDLIKLLDPKKTIVAINKIDLKKPSFSLDFSHIVEISALNNLNIDLLKDKIEILSLKDLNTFNEEIIITNKRHKNALENSINYLLKVEKNILNNSLEFVSLDLKDSLKELSSIIGRDVTEDILSSIFKNFCIGK
jgi:tRNA modification GTPase